MICIAPNYKKYDLLAVQVMGANIELWRYRRYDTGLLYLEEVYRSSQAGKNAKRSKLAAAGKKAALTAKTGSYTMDQHLEGRPEHLQELVQQLIEAILGLDDSIEELPKKFYIAYRSSQNIVCLEVQKKKIYVFLKLSKEEVGPNAPATYRDVSNIGHYGTGDAEFTVASQEDFEAVKPFIEQCYQKIG